MKHSLFLTLIILFGSLTLAPAEDLNDFLGKIRSSDGNVRRAAWEGAAAQGKEAIPPLAQIAGGENRDAAIAASRALDRIAHSSAAPDSKTRKEVAAALAGLLAEEKVAVKVKIQAIDLLSSVGESEAVPAIAKTLQDTELRDWGRKALQRLPGEESAKALEAALAGATGEFLEALIATLGHKKARSAVPALTALTREGADSTRIEAARALARIGDPETSASIVETIKSISNERLRAQLVDDYLKMGDDLAASGQRQHGERIYKGVFARARDENHRYAALFALAKASPADYLEVLLKTSEDPSAELRSLAMELLIAAKGEAVDQALVERYRQAQGAQKAMLLRALATRKSPGVENLIQEAAREADLEVKVTALDLSGGLGDSSLEPLLVEAAQKGSPEVKGIALKSYLALAEGKAKADPPAAAGMFARILDLADSPALLMPALLGLARTGDAGASARIEAARQGGKIAGEASRAAVIYYAAIGKAGKKEEAVAKLMEIISAPESREIIRLASASLKELGADPAVFQKKQGLVTSWWLFGPLPNKEGKGFDTAYSPEEKVSLNEQKDERGRTRKWEQHQTLHESGVVELEAIFRRNQEVCAYAYAEIEAEKDQEVLVKIGSDDGVICWLNGLKIHSNNATRSHQLDQDVAKGHLKAGKNTLLLKITQGGGEWAFSARLTDREGKPLDLTR